MSEKSNSLWNEFNLAGNNPDQGGAIIYCMRYNEEIIKQKRKQVISALDSLNVIPKEIDGNKISVEMNSPEINIDRINCLLEELSVLNGALEYKNSFGDEVGSIEELRAMLTNIYYIIIQSNDIVKLYNYTDIYLGDIINELILAEKQNGVFTKKQKAIIEELIQFRERQLKALNSPGGIVVIG